MAIVYQGPLTITTGGTYTGNYRSDNSSIPAITVNTNQPVIITGCNVLASGEHIHAGGGTNMNIHHNTFLGQTPSGNNQWGRVVDVYQPVSFTFEHNTVEHTGGIRVDHSGGSGPNVIVRYNSIKNTDKRKVDNTEGDHRAGILCDGVTAMTGEISWNYFENEPNNSWIEDNINLRNSGGISSSHFKIHNNYIRGAYPVPLSYNPGNFTGSGITVEGSPEFNQANNVSQYIDIYNNQIVSVMNGGINVNAGHDIHVYSNKIIASGYIDGVYYSSFWSGGAIWNGSNVPYPSVFHDIVYDNNTVGYYRPGVNVGGTNRQDWVFVSGSPININPSLNTSLPNPITEDMEDAELPIWNNKVSSAGYSIGNNIAPMIYYISNTGSNSNNGTSEGTPWQTVAKINSSTFQPGDQILFKRGQTHRGGLVVPSSGASNNPITFGTYDVGARPIISGMVDVTSWSAIGSNKYTATVAGPDRINILTVGGTQKWMGRFPKTGWYTIASSTRNSPNSSLTGDMPSTTNFNGGEVVMKKNEWAIDKHTIVGHSGATITFLTAGSGFLVQDGFGYFVQNHIGTVTTQDDWHYNPTTDVLTMYSTSTPTNVRVATVETLFTNNGKNYIVLDNLVFEGANKNCVYIDSGAVGNTVRNCDYSLAGLQHIDAVGTTNLNIQFNTFSYANNQAIYSQSGVGTNVSNNILTQIGMIRGAGANDNESCNGMRIAGTNCIIELNTISYTGYCGINPTGQNMMVRKNYVHHHCMNVTDGGGIYNGGGDTTTGKIFEDNICLYGYGDSTGTPYVGSSNSCFGIYGDEANANLTIRRNTCAFNGAGSSGGGIYLHKSFNINVYDNILYDNYGCQFKLSQDLPNPEINGGNIQKMTGLSFYNNVAYSTNNGQYIYLFYCTPPPDDDIDIMFTLLNNNILARPTGGTNQFRTHEWTSDINTDYTLAGWKAAYAPYDVNSVPAPAAFGTPRFELNTTNANRVVSLDGTYKDIKGVDYTNTITLAPYSSNILTKTADASTALPVVGIKVVLV